MDRTAGWASVDEAGTVLNRSQAVPDGLDEVLEAVQAVSDSRPRHIGDQIPSASLTSGEQAGSRWTVSKSRLAMNCRSP
jgi:hypothetical protein